jgi:hypothetical protein
MTYPVAGSWFDPEKAKSYIDLFGKDMGGLISLQEQRSLYENDPQRLKEKLEVLGPWYENIANKSQQLGLQSNLLGAGITAIQDIPRTMLAMRAIPLAGMSEQTQNLSNMFVNYGSGRPGFQGISARLRGV